ncbi:MAG: EAL domain-containing protein [Halofilum sp. (in: g-proteobacteria)]|nr:EAL domain-containing protein [Halofilum sp. (in: g-proteobacteria)]
MFSDIVASLIEQDMQRTREKDAIRQRIQATLDAEDLSIVWQPIVDAGSSRIIGGEALSRFPADRGRSPADWFADAAEVGMTEEVELHAVERALGIFDELPEEMSLSCNASAGAFATNRIAEVLARAPSRRLVLELTEHDVIGDYEALERALAPLRRQGLRLAVDDAGAGYASFRHILRLEPDFSSSWTLSLVGGHRSRRLASFPGRITRQVLGRYRQHAHCRRCGNAERA